MKRISWLWPLLVLILPWEAGAGLLTLKNGDRLGGELIKLEAEVVIWVSDSFGKLTVDKNKIENLQTSTLLKINGYDDACTVYGVEGVELIYSCDKHGPGRVALQTLEVVLPYEDYLAGAHTYHGRLGLAGTYSRGNKVEDDWDLDSEVEFRRGDFRHMVQLEYEGKSLDNAPADEKFKVEYGLDWFYQTRWFWYNDVTASADESKNLDERYSLGSGFGYQVWEIDRTALSLQGGVTFVKELFDRPEGEVEDFESSDDLVAWELSAKYRYKLPLGAEVFHTNKLIQSLKDNADWRFDSNTGLNIPLGAGLFSEFRVEYDVDNQPQSGNRREDTKLRVGIGYDW